MTISQVKVFYQDKAQVNHFSHEIERNGRQRPVTKFFAWRKFFFLSNYLSANTLHSLFSCYVFISFLFLFINLILLWLSRCSSSFHSSIIFSVHNLFFLFPNVSFVSRSILWVLCWTVKAAFFVVLRFCYGSKCFAPLKDINLDVERKLLIIRNSVMKQPSLNAHNSAVSF